METTDSVMRGLGFTLVPSLGLQYTQNRGRSPKTIGIKDLCS